MNKKFVIIVAVCALLIGLFYVAEQHQYENDLEQLPNQEAVCGTGGGCSVSDDITFGYQTGMYIPNMVLTDFEGEEFYLYDLIEGKDWFIINLGVEWCSDCQRDFDKMDTYYDTLPKEIGIANVYIDYSKEDDPEKQASYEGAKADAESHKVPAYYDVDNQFYDAFNVANTPTTIIIDGSGKIKCVASEMDLDKLILPNTETVTYPIPTQETYDAAQ